MSAYSDHKHGYISDDEYKSAMRRECADFYDRPPDVYDYTCQECEFCKLGKTFAYTIADIYGKEPPKEEPRHRLVLKKTKRYGYVDLCTRDIENIREISRYDDVCEDHGELFKPEGE